MATITEVKPSETQPDALSNDEILRYSRHLIMPEVGMEGQQKLKAARVLCIGAGGLGSPLALYLGRGGRRHTWNRGLRRGGLHESAAADHSQHRRRGPEKIGFCGREAEGDQSIFEHPQV